MKQKNLIILATCAFLSLVSNFAAAKPEGRPRTPPPEAFEACENKALGDEVSITTRRGDDLSATCQASPDDENVLVAVPEGHMREKKED